VYPQTEKKIIHVPPSDLGSTRTPGWEPLIYGIRYF